MTSHLWRHALLTLLLGLVFSLAAQPSTETIPLDPSVRTGTLSNGLTYFIRKNQKPEKRVELRLAVNTGSVQEDADQLGLAHFVEHMCFRGTERFPGLDVIHYLQSVGSGFGPDINAYTSFDQTVYQLTLPSDSAETLGNGFKIMEDWAHAVSFVDTIIDEERKVIVEEWRLGRGPDQRMRDKYLPVLLKDSKYAERLPIGTKESIEGATHEALKRFYHDWYRPDNMAFIVVGDIDPDKVEQDIKAGFGSIPAAKEPRPVSKFSVPNHTAPLYSIVSDKENPYNVAILAWKAEPAPLRTRADERRNLAENLVMEMLNDRLAEVQKQANPPFVQAQARNGRLFTRAKDAFQAFVVVQDGGFERGIASVETEVERARRHGFTQSELDRAKKSMLKNYERAYNERDKTQSAALVNEYVDYYLDGAAAPGIAFEYAFANSQIPEMTLEEINPIASRWITDTNQVTVLRCVEKEGSKVPTEEALKQLSSTVRASKIAPYSEKQLPVSLLAAKPVAGTIVSSKEIPELGVTELMLSNGIKVVLKPSTFQNDQILVSGFRPGGSSTLPDDEEFSSQIGNAYPSEAGLGAFTATDLQKFLAGKKVSASLQVGQYYDQVSGSCVVSDLPTLFELIHLNFTQPRKDQAAFDSLVSRQKAILKNVISNPIYFFNNEVQKIQYKNHPRNRNVLPTEADWAAVSLDKVLGIQRARFSNANGFTIIIVGSFQVEGIKPLLETYLASLPSAPIEPAYRDLGIRSIEGPFQQQIQKGKDPKSIALVTLESPAEWTRNEAHQLWSLGNILQRTYTDKLREEMNGVYGLRVGAGLGRSPVGQFSFVLNIPCAPQNADKLVAAALDEIRRIQKDGLKPEEIQKEVESQKRAAEKDAKENRSWLVQLSQIYRDKESFGRLSNPEELIALVNAEDLQKVAVKYLNVDKVVRFTLYPEQTAAQPTETKAKE